VRNLLSFQCSVDHDHFSIELHTWWGTESCTFATFIYDKGGERLLQRFTGWDENEVICQALKWCEQN
jgi:hypothetical protein